MDKLEINNSVKVSELFNGKTWIHGKSKDNIKITLFLITISSDQLQYSLDAINKLNTNNNIIVNVIMNVSPTNTAYNEMRVRCKTDYFIQNDEDMELYPHAIDILNKTISKNKKGVYLSTFKLIDDKLGIGSPPIIDCLKLYSNDIMKDYPTPDTSKATSSVDQLWNKKILEDGFTINSTNTIIGYHGKHRSNFDLFLRYCKISRSFSDDRIRTGSSHVCKLSRGLDHEDINTAFLIIHKYFEDNYQINSDLLNKIIKKINSPVSQGYLDMYGIKNKPKLSLQANSYSKENLLQLREFEPDNVYAIVAIMCIASGNYEYSYDKYPTDIFNYFSTLVED